MGKKIDVIFVISLTVIVLSLIFYVLFFKAQVDTPSRFDDAYRYLRYSNNILSGHGIAWNPGWEQVFGATNLLYLFALTLARSVFRIPAMAVLKLGSLVPGGLGLLLLFAACRLRTGKGNARNLLIAAALTLPLLLSQKIFLAHLGRGADTMLSFFCNTLLIFSVLSLLKRPGAGRAVAVSVCAYLTYLARPDNAIIAVLFPCLAILFLQEDNNKKRTLVVFFLSITPLFAMDAALKILAFGDFLPLAYYAERTVFSLVAYCRGNWNPFIFFNSFLSITYPFLLITIFMAERKHIRLLAVFMIPVLLTFLYYFRIIHVAGSHGRYYFPSLPFIVVCAVICFQDFLCGEDKIKAFTPRGLTVRVLLAIALFYVSLILHSENSRTVFTKYLPKPYEIDWTSFRMGDSAASKLRHEPPWWGSILDMTEVAERFPEGTVMTGTEHGYVSFMAPHVPIIDLTGLNDAHIARNGFSMEYLLEKKPDVIWMPYPAYPGMFRDILENKAFQKEYEYYPKAAGFGLAIRKDSKRYYRIMELTEQARKKIYTVE